MKIGRWKTIGNYIEMFLCAINICKHRKSLKIYLPGALKAKKRAKIYITQNVIKS